MNFTERVDEEFKKAFLRLITSLPSQEAARIARDGLSAGQRAALAAEVYEASPHTVVGSNQYRIRLREGAVLTVIDRKTGQRVAKDGDYFMKQNEHKEEEEQKTEAMNYFHAFTDVMDDEQLIRFRKRFQKRGWAHMVELMTGVIERREEAEKAEHKKKKHQ